jgi:hypothetical protein
MRPASDITRPRVVNVDRSQPVGAGPLRPMASGPASSNESTRLSVTLSPWTVLVALGILALALRLSTFTGLIGSDDLHYAKYAQAVVEGSYHDTVDAAERRHHALRYAVILPVALAYRLFGVSEWTTILVPLMASVLSVVLLAEIGRRMFGWRVALIAALLYATFPIQLILGTMLLPEPIAGFYVLLGVLCYLQARERGGAWWVIAGLLMGTAYLAKEPALFVGGAFLLHVIWERRWRGAALFVLGVAAIGAAEHAYYLGIRGDILFRPHSTQLFNIHAPENQGAFNENLGYRLFRQYPRMMLSPTLKFGLHSILCLIGTALALALKPRRGYLMVALWASVPWLYLNFGSWSLERYAPLPRDDRYLEIVFPPLMLMTSIVFNRLISSGQVISRVAVSVLAVVMGVGFACGLAARGRTADAEEMNVLREIVREAQDRKGQSIFTAEEEWSRAIRVFDASILSRSPETATITLSRGDFGFPQVRRASPGPDPDAPHHR